MNKIELYTGFNPDNSSKANLEGIRSRMWNHVKPYRWVRRFTLLDLEEYELDMERTLSVLISNESN